MDGATRRTAFQKMWRRGLSAAVGAVRGFRSGCWDLVRACHPGRCSGSEPFVRP
jgi:hypothetical protein